VAPRAAVEPPRLDGTTSEHTADIEDTTAMAFFAAPAWAAEGSAAFLVAATYLERALSEQEDQLDWVTDTAVSIVGGKRQRVLEVAVSVRDPDRLDDGVELIRAQVGRLIRRVEWGGLRGTIRRLQREYVSDYDAFLSRGTWIADYLMYTTDNAFFLREMDELDALEAADVRDWALDNLVETKMHLALVRPTGEVAAEPRLSVAAATRVSDVQPWRSPVDPADAHRALAADTTRVDTRVEDFTLDNGLRVLLAYDPGASVVDARLVYPVGSAADPADRPGLAYATAYLVAPNPDIEDRVTYAKIAWAMKLGTSITFDVDETTTQFSARSLSVFADWTVWRLYYLLDYSVFPSKAIEAMHRAAARAGDPDRDVRSAAVREKLFGKDHPYAGDALTADDVRRIGRKDLERFRNRHYKAKGATLIVSGGFDLVAMEQEVKEVFGAWDAAAPADVAPVPRPHPAKGPSWLAFRDPGATQAHLTIDFATGSEPDVDRAARRILVELLRDRVRVVRESLGASYGVAVRYGPNDLQLETDLDPERGGEAAAALLAELTRLRDAPADLDEDFVRARKRAMAHALADTAGASDTADDLVFVAAHGLTLDYFSTLAETIGRLTIDDLQRLIATDLAEKRMVVAISGREPVVQAILEAAGVDAAIIDLD
jgi:zinc protease